jgi:2-(1,2-epoxy-1,2-dihydrophenyl)acetyl-CoA isomerase
MDTTLLVEQDGAVVTITLNRPDKLNSFNEAMHREFRSALDQIEKEDGARAVLITAAGRGFCAGQDLGDRNVAADQDIDLGATLDANYNPLVRRLRVLEKPTICAVNGVAAGAGANLALACDIVIAARSARFIQAFCKIGLVPDSGGTYFLPRLIGDARARALTLLGDSVSAEQAETWGLVWKAVDDDRLLTEARALAQDLAAGPTKGLGLIKRALNASFANDLNRQLDLERDLQREAGRTSDYREGVSAFVQKRPPVFRGS